MMTPSRVARLVASQEWGPIQSQSMLCKGVYSFDSAGHGGEVAVHGFAPLSDKAWDCARVSGLTVKLVEVSGRLYRTDRYEVQGYISAGVCPVHEVWVGEEDCAWSTLGVASPEIKAAIMARWVGGVDVQYVTDCCKRYHHGFYKLLMGE